MEGEKVASDSTIYQKEAKQDDESLSDFLERRVNKENKVALKEDEQIRCDYVGYLESTGKAVNSYSTTFHETETSPEAESGRGIDSSLQSPFPESTVHALETSGETQNLKYTREDFESGCSSSDTEEHGAMGAIVCSISRNKDTTDKLHEEAKKKTQRSSKDTKKYKQQTLSFYEPKLRSKEGSKYRQTTQPYSRRGDRHTRKTEEKNEKTVQRNQFIDKDTQDYRNGYPDKEDNPCLNSNLRFYRGEIMSTPKGAYIDDIHENWWGDLELLESHHGYIQWLFPIRESGMNSKAQPLQLHEAEAIKSDPKTKKRVLKSYKMMLDFYGMKLQSEQTGKLVRSENWKKCFHNLKRSPHNYLRITRVLKCLGELGYEHLKKGLLQFVLEEALLHHTLVETLTSCRDYWIGTIKDDQDRKELYRYIDEHESSY